MSGILLFCFLHSLAYVLCWLISNVLVDITKVCASLGHNMGKLRFDFAGYVSKQMTLSSVSLYYNTCFGFVIEYLFWNKPIE